MAIYIPKANLMFLHIPKTGGLWITKMLKDFVIGDSVLESGTRHCRLSESGIFQLNNPTTFSVWRDPEDWLKSYHAMKLEFVKDRTGWGLYEVHTPFHPTWVLDLHCGSKDFQEFKRRVGNLPFNYFDKLYNEWYPTTHRLMFDNVREGLINLLNKSKVRINEKAIRESAKVNTRENRS